MNFIIMQLISVIAFVTLVEPHIAFMSNTKNEGVKIWKKLRCCSKSLKVYL